MFDLPQPFGPTMAVTPASKRSEEHTSELQSQSNLVCRLLLEKKKEPLHSLPTLIIFPTVVRTRRNALPSCKMILYARCPDCHLGVAAIHVHLRIDLTSIVTVT